MAQESVEIPSKQADSEVTEQNVQQMQELRKEAGVNTPTWLNLALQKDVKESNQEVENEQEKKTKEKILNIQKKINELETQKENLKGGANKKKRAVVNKKLKKLRSEIEAHASQNTNIRIEDLYDFGWSPAVPPKWFATEPALGKYNKILNSMNAADLRSLSSAHLKTNHGIKNGSHRTKIIKLAGETLQKLDFKPRLKNGVFKETLAAGDGKTYPQKGQLVYVFYEGMLLGTNTIFDATDKEPFTFQIGNNEVIQGWDLGIPKLSLGEKARLYIRSDFGYGEQGCRSVIPPNADLLFQVELLKIEDPIPDLKDALQETIFSAEQELESAKNETVDVNLLEESKESDVLQMKSHKIEEVEAEN